MTAGNVSRHRIALTALEQQREDQALGAAWRRCEAALPEGWGFGVTRAKNGMVSAVAASPANRWDWKGYGPTPTAALVALAEKLEALNG